MRMSTTSGRLCQLRIAMTKIFIRWVNREFVILAWALACPILCWFSYCLPPRFLSWACMVHILLQNGAGAWRKTDQFWPSSKAEGWLLCVVVFFFDSSFNIITGFSIHTLRTQSVCALKMSKAESGLQLSFLQLYHLFFYTILFVQWK